MEASGMVEAIDLPAGLGAWMLAAMIQHGGEEEEGRHATGYSLFFLDFIGIDTTAILSMAYNNSCSIQNILLPVGMPYSLFYLPPHYIPDIPDLMPHSPSLVCSG